jgi:hypothetical protein
MQQTLTPSQVNSCKGVVPLCTTRQLTLLAAQHPTTQAALSRGHASMAAWQKVHSCFVSHVELWIWPGPDCDQEEGAVKSSFHQFQQTWGFGNASLFRQNVKCLGKSVSFFLKSTVPSRRAVDALERNTPATSCQASLPEDASRRQETHTCISIGK